MQILGASIYDLSGSLLAIISIVFIMRKSTWYWYLSILCNALWFLLFMNEAAYIAGGLQISYILFSIYAVIRWQLAKKQRLIPGSLEYVGGFLSLLAICIAILNTEFIDITNYLELVGVILLIIANWLTARQAVSCWYFWMMGDLIFASFLWNKQIYATFTAQVVLFIFSFRGLLEWKKSTVRSAGSDAKKSKVAGDLS
ncbi:MAG TPA: nicotinamide mononucleotide transporter family protein [Bacillota bacterium]